MSAYKTKYYLDHKVKRDLASKAYSLQHPLFTVLNTMKSRCNNKNVHAYKWYGGRGIKVCDEWRVFKVFEAWAYANGYQKGLTIDRIDNDGNYEPSNCRWITQSENSKSRQLINGIQLAS